MKRNSNRLATGVFAVITGLAVASVSTAYAAEEGPIMSTTCGAGTITECNKEPVESCDWDLSFDFDPATRKFGFHIKRTDCKVVAWHPIYKDIQAKDNVLSGDCNILNAALGMPTGTGCR